MRSCAIPLLVFLGESNLRSPGWALLSVGLLSIEIPQPFKCCSWFRVRVILGPRLPPGNHLQTTRVAWSTLGLSPPPAHQSALASCIRLISLIGPIQPKHHPDSNVSPDYKKTPPALPLISTESITNRARHV